MPVERLRLYKVCIRSAALHVRDVLRYTGSNDTEHRRLVLEAMARCIWKNDTRTARTLLEVSHIARENICLSEGKVRPLDFGKFEDLYIREKREHHARHQTSLKSEMKNSSINVRK